MRVARAFLFASFAVMGAFGWSACVGDDPTTNSGNDEGGGPGSIGNACFANGTCDQGLSCISNVCVDLDSGAGTDGASSDAAEDSSSKITDSGAGDSSTPCDSGPITAVTTVPCGAGGCDQTATQNVCCAQAAFKNSTCIANTDSCTTGTADRIACVGLDGCKDSPGTVCCAQPQDAGTSFVETTCPPTAVLGGSICRPLCGTGELLICTSDAECDGDAGLTCTVHLTSYGGIDSGAPELPFALGLCVPK